MEAKNKLGNFYFGVLSLKRLYYYRNTIWWLWGWLIWETVRFIGVTVTGLHSAKFIKIIWINICGSVDIRKYSSLRWSTTT